MVNKKQIKIKKLRGFSKSLIEEHDNMFRKTVSKELAENNPKFYPEFQQLYKE
jgi:hypothetical protein